MAITLYAFQAPRIHGAIYYVHTNPKSSYKCANDSTCDIYCDSWETVDNTEYNCGNVIDCYFHCDEWRCAENAVIIATNSSTLTLTQDKDGQECLSGAAIYTPQNGNAYFYTQSKIGFKKMNVYAGLNAQQIVIDTSLAIKDEKKNDYQDMSVYASTAEYLKIIIADGFKWSSGTVECPINSSYNGSSCIIESYGVLGSLNITQNDGITFITPNPTANPTIPTLNPTISPTQYPSNAPSMSPTEAPSFFPTKPPTKNPSNAPTIPPTLAPSTSPTVKPSNAPTIPPTHTPSTAPTISTQSPSNSPTNTPSAAPSKYPSKAPFETENTSAFVIAFGIVFGTFWMFVCIYFYKYQKMEQQLGETYRKRTKSQYGEEVPPTHVVHSSSQNKVDSDTTNKRKKTIEPGSFPVDGVIEMNNEKHKKQKKQSVKSVHVAGESSSDSHDSLWSTEPIAETVGVDTKGAEVANNEQMERDKGQIKVSLWMMKQVKLSEYTILLLNNGFDTMESVTEITIEDLEAIGITKIGHRRQIVKFAKKLKEEQFFDSD